METHKLHVSGLGVGVSFQPKVHDEQEDKTTGINEGTGTIPGVPNVPKYQSKSENESWRDSRDDDSNDDDNDDVTIMMMMMLTMMLMVTMKQVTVKRLILMKMRILVSIRTKMKKKNMKKSIMQSHGREKREMERCQMCGRGGMVLSKIQLQDEEDAYVTLTTAHITQKIEGLMQSSSVSSDFASQFLNLDNVPPTDNEVVSMMNVKVSHEEPSTQTPSFLTIPVTSRILAIVDAQLSTRREDSIQKDFRSYIAEFEKKAQDEKKRYIDLIEKLVKEIIKDEVNTQVPQILPKEISDFATLVIQSTITESLKNVILAKSSSQPQSTYEAAVSLTEFELKKILLDKI
ncbi:hypothetical protein Tco_0699728 [Tanacetum coccineum]